MSKLSKHSRHPRLSFSVIFAVVGILLGASTLVETLAIASAISNDVRASQATTNHFNPAESAESDLLIGYLEQETGLRGYVLTGDATFLTPFVAGTSAVNSAYKILFPAIAPYPKLQRLLNTVQSVGRGWEISASLHEIVPSLIESGLPTAVQASLKSDKHNFDILQNDINSLSNATINTKQAAQSAATQALTKLKNTVVVSGVVSLLIIAGIVIMFAKMIVTPMKRLERVANTVASGSLGSVVALRGVHEISSLSTSIDQMRLGILNEMDLQRKNALLETQYQERREVAQAIHDNPLQLLAAARIRLQLNNGSSNLESSIVPAIELIDRASSWMRNMISNLYPLGLTHSDLEQAVKEHLDSVKLGTVQSIATNIELSALQRRDKKDLPALFLAFRCVQELSANALKGAGGGPIALFALANKQNIQITSINPISASDIVTLEEIATILAKSSSRHNRRTGHLGIPLLSDSVEIVGGTFTIRIFQSIETSKESAIVYTTRTPWSNSNHLVDTHNDPPAVPWISALRNMQSSQKMPIVVVSAELPLLTEDPRAE